MTAPTNVTPNTPATVDPAATDAAAEAAARKSATAEALAMIPPEERARIMLRRQANLVTAQIAGTNWGKGMDVETAKAVSDWGQRHGIDVTKEIYILGGNIYLNAEFYLNRLATLIAQGRVLDWRQSFVNIDARLDEHDPAERAEMQRRRQARLRFNIPDEATAAVVTELELVSMPGVVIYGVKWAPRHANDSVGKAYPQETALTRSARRALKQAVRYMPELATIVEGAEEDAAVSIAATLAEHAQKRRAEIAGESAKQLGAGTVPPVQGAEYADGKVPVTPLNTAAVADPYAGAGQGRDDHPATDTAPPPAAPAPREPEALDDLDLLSPAERAEYDARKRDGRA